MNTEALRNIGLTNNEIKIYITLLKVGSSTAYEISQKTGIYRIHVYDKLEQLQKKGLVTQIYKGAKKFFQATSTDKIKQYLEEQKKEFEEKEQDINNLLPKLKEITNIQKEDTHVEVFQGKEGLKYFLKDIVKTKKELLITGIDDAKYNEVLPSFMEQYFRDLRLNKIKERVITIKKKDIFLFKKKTAKFTKYRYLNSTQFNPTNTFIYGNKVVIVTWGTPITAIMIINNEIAETYRNNFEHLWKIASKTND